MSARQCTAKSKRSGNRCRRPPIIGGAVCFQHGGGSPQVQAAAKRRLAEARAASSLAGQGVQPLGDPLEAFRSLVEEVVAFKDFLGARVAELQQALTRTDKTGREEVRADLAAYERALDRAGRLLADYTRLGIEDRLAALDERRAALVEALLLRVLVAVGVDVNAEDTRQVVYRELRAISGGER